MRRVLIAAAAACAVLTGAAFAQDQQGPTLPATPQAWRAGAETDLEALRMHIREDTPVAIDSENPRMQRWFDQGYREARRRVRRVTDQPSYFYALAAYTNGFQDPHLNLQSIVPLSVARWPGFITTANGEDTVVISNYGAEGSAPENGARLISCDGKSPARLRERTVFPFTMNPQLARDRRAAHTRLFLDRGNIFAPPPRRCVFEQNGARVRFDLTWRDVSGDDFWTRYNIATTGPGAEFGVSAPEEGITWIGVPSLANESGDQLRALVDQIKANAASIRAGHAVIIDVRGNGGGNSEWGAEIARALWGDEVISAIPESNPGGATDWRVSQRNLDYINSFAPQLIAQFGEESGVAQWVRQAQQNFAASLAANEPLWRERDPGETGPIPQSGGYTQRRPEGPSPIPARVYILSNGTCASACLDFADIVMHIPGTQLIGMDTSGDGLLMEIRDQTLPSGLARVNLPLKVYRGRARGALEAYHADIAYDGVWDDLSVRNWAIQVVQRQ
ncbi:MAG: S41 family peptidase [Alphaproteobacteria bacterium]|nr:S41 family peptidase [Alphaproteobacteria bacterium]